MGFRNNMQSNFTHVFLQISLSYLISNVINVSELKNKIKQVQKAIFFKSLASIKTV